MDLISTGAHTFARNGYTVRSMMTTPPSFMHSCAGNHAKSQGAVRPGACLPVRLAWVVLAGSSAHMSITTCKDLMVGVLRMPPPILSKMVAFETRQSSAAQEKHQLK